MKTSEYILNTLYISCLAIFAYLEISQWIFGYLVLIWISNSSDALRDIWNLTENGWRNFLVRTGIGGLVPACCCCCTCRRTQIHVWPSGCSLPNGKQQPLQPSGRESSTRPDQPSVLVVQQLKPAGRNVHRSGRSARPNSSARWPPLSHEKPTPPLACTLRELGQPLFQLVAGLQSCHAQHAVGRGLCRLRLARNKSVATPPSLRRSLSLVDQKFVAWRPVLVELSPTEDVIEPIAWACATARSEASHGTQSNRSPSTWEVGAIFKYL